MMCRSHLMRDLRSTACGPPSLISSSLTFVYPIKRAGKYCALRRVKGDSLLWKVETLDNYPSSFCRLCEPVRAACRNFTRWRICPSRSRWRPSCAWQPRRLAAPAAKPSQNRKTKKRLSVFLPTCLMRRNYMLDVIIVLVTIVLFAAFIGFTEGCERL